MIRAETLQMILFALATSLFVYLTKAFLTWFVKESKPKKYRGMARAP